MKGIFVKHLIVIVMVIALILNTIRVDIYAEDDVNIYLNNEKVAFTDFMGYPFIDDNSRTQVPFRMVLEEFGAHVSYNDEKRIAIAQKGDITVRVPIGEKYIYKDDEIIINDTEAVIIQGRTYLPIRAVMEAFGCDVNWIGVDRRVDIDFTEEVQIIAGIPGYYDLRNSFRVTDVKDQGELGTCWAFAAIGAIESSLKKTKEYDLSEDHMSLTHGYNIPQTGGGDYEIIMAYLARWDGPVLEKDDIYGDGETNEKAQGMFHIQESMFLPYKDYDAIKIAVMYYGAVQSSIFMTPNITKEESDYFNTDTNAYYYNGNRGMNHDIVIVGWDNAYPKENFKIQPKRDGAFICKNSYGNGFGENGYFYISYQDTKIGTNNIVYSRIDSVDNYDNLYQTDQLGWVGRLGYGSDTAYFSNVYETQSETETLEAVSFYATGMNSHYEVYVVKDFESVDDFKDMKFYKRGKLEHKGYYTIDFNQPIEVFGKFAVVVKMTTPNVTLPVAAEYDKDAYWLGDVDITDGEGYMSGDGKSWERTEEILNGNVILKAFTNDL